MSSSHCLQNPPNLNSGIHGVGTVLELGGLQSYVTGPSSSKLALILISDIFGKIQNPSSISYLSTWPILNFKVSFILVTNYAFEYLSPMCISPPSSLILFIKQITLVSYFFIELNMFLVAIKLPIICYKFWFNQ